MVGDSSLCGNGSAILLHSSPADILDIHYGDFHLTDCSSLHVTVLTYTVIERCLEPGYPPWLHLGVNW